MKSGFICIAGIPNAGKSTLINSLVGEKVAIVSWRPQTTRNKIIASTPRTHRSFSSTLPAYTAPATNWANT